jgi:hypothetical protein
MKQAGESLAIDIALMSKLAAAPASTRHDEIPMLNAIVRFPGSAAANRR